MPNQTAADVGSQPRRIGAQARLIEAWGFGTWRCLWKPAQLNWWIATVFALGSLLFIIASSLSLSTELAKALSLSTWEVNAIFFAGSIPFTSAAFLQFYQSASTADAGTAVPRKYRRTLFRWRPDNIDWLSSGLQLIGTILFNFDTFDAMRTWPNGFQRELAIWVPNLVGSVLFLTSGYLAWIQTCHGYWAWQPASISYWVALMNLLGCTGFMVSALFANALPASHPWCATTSVLFTLFGAVGFFIGSILMLPEMAVATALPPVGESPDKPSPVPSQCSARG